MGKKKSAAKVESKASAKAAKKVKAEQKIDKKQKKKQTKADDDDEEDLETILEKMRQEWEDAHAVTEELVEGPPSRRANATMTACPNGNHLWCIGGEFFSPDNKAYFYNDVFRYNPEKDEWRKYVSKVCPGPRSAHAVVPYPAGGGKLFLFGGEFSSLHQNSFHHYRDFWCFDVSTHSWDRIDTKIRPSARSGHRMAVWKHYVVLFGGFYDPGITTRYHDDLWVFDIQEYKWQMIEFKANDARPSARSGFSFLPTAEGIVLHGGYCKEYAKGKRPVGVMLEDTWYLRFSIAQPDATSTSKKAQSERLVAKWERRKRHGKAYAPSLRSGCTMALWAARDMGVLFGGVSDEDPDEENLTSVFFNDLNGYQWADKGRWISMMLKKPKKAKGPTKKKTAKQVSRHEWREEENEDFNEDGSTTVAAEVVAPAEPEIDADDPILTTPLPRYNAMLAVLRNTLYIYGGIYESAHHEYTLDDFYSLQLDKMERYVCLKKSDVVIKSGEESESDEDDEDDDDDDDDDEYDSDNETLIGSQVGDEEEDELVAGKRKLVDTILEEEEAEDEAQPEPEAESDIRLQATAFMGVAKSNARSEEDVISTPAPGETLAAFYARSREYWAQKATSDTDARGKELRRDGFELAKEKYETYKPILQEIEKILAEAGDRKSVV